MANEINISNEEEFINFLSKIDNEEYLKSTVLKADKLSVSMKIEGDKFNSSLTGSLIKALADYQDKV